MTLTLSRSGKALKRDGLGSAVKVNEIFKSIQGESTYAGFPCVFVRLTGCNLRCRYCDTEYAYEDGRDWTIGQLLEKVREYTCGLVEITGGEPLLQPATRGLIRHLISEKFTVLLETNGSMDIGGVNEAATIIMDIKCPGSGMSGRNLWGNIPHLKRKDEVKFVIQDKRDFLWSRSVMKEFALAERCNVLLSPAFGQLHPATLAGWILEGSAPVRMQLQLHKYIWHPDTRGV